MDTDGQLKPQFKIAKSIMASIHITDFSIDNIVSSAMFCHFKCIYHYLFNHQPVFGQEHVSFNTFVMTESIR